jgi:hypothetical protein
MSPDRPHRPRHTYAVTVHMLDGIWWDVYVTAPDEQYARFYAGQKVQNLDGIDESKPVTVRLVEPDPEPPRAA